VSPDHLVTFQFTGRQQQICASLVQKREDLADLYEGALRAYSDKGNPARIILAAHAMRELADNLPKALNLPIPVDPGKITEQMEKIEPVWSNACKSACRADGKWSGHIDKRLEKLLQKLEAFFEWMKENRGKRREIARQMFRTIDPAELPLPETLEQIRTQQWGKLRRYFSNSAHGIPTADAEFEANVEALEKILLDSLYREPSEDLSAIDQILEEGAKDA
jgi:hypothetical protein